MKALLLVSLAALFSASQDPADFARQAEEKLSRNDLEGAIRDADAALKKDPKQVSAYILRATGLIRQEYYFRAVEDARKAVELAPNDPHALFVLGWACDMKEDFPAALEAYTKALTIDPEKSIVYCRRAGVRYRVGDYEGALADCNQASSRDPGNSEATFHRASALTASGRWGDAASAYEDYLKQPGADAWMHQAQAMAETLRESPSNGSPLTPSARLIAQARVELAAGLKTRASTLLEEVVRMNSDHPEARELLIEIYSNGGKAKETERQLMKSHLFRIIGTGKGLTPELRRIYDQNSSAVSAGVLWLDRHQHADGRWSATTFGDACGCGGKGSISDVRTTAWALLAHFGAGFSPLSRENFGTKPIATSISEGLAWLGSQQGADGGFPGEVTDQAAATLCLSEIFGMADLKIYREPAQKGVDRLLGLRIPGKGWPGSSGGKTPDARTTGWALQALKSAVLSELHVPREAIEEAVDWLMSPSDSPIQPLIAATMVVEHRRKVHWDAVAPIVETAAGQALEVRPANQDAEAMLFWTLGIRQAKNVEPWKQWSRPVRNLLVKLTRWDEHGVACVAGSSDPASEADRTLGRPAVTALNLLTLEVHYAFQNNLIGAGLAE
jgi:tetratricopeptide (TPR) repeat protein